VYRHATAAPHRTVVELSRWQFAITAVFHMTFPALTVGLCVLLVLVVLLAVVCAVYVRTGNPLYLQITVSEEDLSPSASA
jgi:cytochrome bd-type quinol oxidase subunit 1